MSALASLPKGSMAAGVWLIVGVLALASLLMLTYFTHLDVTAQSLVAGVLGLIATRSAGLPGSDGGANDK